MTGTRLQDGFEQLVQLEPPMTLGLDPVLVAGRRMRRRRRLGQAGAGMALLVAGGAGVAVLMNGSAAPTNDRLAVTPFALTGSKASSSTDPGLTAEQRRIGDAIRTASPAGWTFAMSPDRWDGPNVESTADDGAGPGRLMLGLSTGRGTQLLHPCADSEFASGVTCTERTLDDGSVLSMRDVVDDKGVEYLDVVVTHPDGTGVMAESGNFTIDWPPPQVATPEQKRHLVHTSRPSPTYDVQQLAQVVLAVNRVAF